MNINYNHLGCGRDTWLKKDVGDLLGSPPKVFSINRTLWAFCLFFVSLVGIHSAAGQSTIPIGSGTGTNTQMPIYTCYGYNYTQQIVTAAEYAAGNGVAGNITKIRFYYDSSGTTITNWNSWTVYLGLTSKTSFTGGGDWIPSSSMTQVYSGTISPVAGNWMELTLSSPFFYDGTSNIVVAVDENSPSWSCTAAFRSYAGGTNRAIYYYNDGTNPDPTAPPTETGITSTLAQIQFVGAVAAVPPSCASGYAPADLATNVARNPVISWSPGSGVPTDYDVYLGTSPSPAFAANVTNTSYTPSSLLAANTTYYYKIVPKNANGAATGCVVNSFTTGTSVIYCTPTTSNGCGSGDHIMNVSIANVANNTSSCISGGSYSNYLGTNINVTQGISYPISVSVSDGGTEYAGVWIDWNANGSFESSEFVALTDADGFSPWIYTGTVNVPVDAQLGATVLRARSSYSLAIAASSACDTYMYGETEDYTFTVEAQPTTPPDCVTTTVPANNATNVFRNPTLSWTAATGVPTSYDIYFGTSSTPPFVTNVASTVTTYTPTAPLQVSTQYYWNVIAKNANGDAVGCSTFTFTTGAGSSYCVPTTTSGCTDGDVIARVTLNTLDNNSGTGCPSGAGGNGYSDYTTNPTLTTTLQAGTSYQCTVYAGQYSEGYAAWIDYNDDGTFAANERIGYSNGQVTGSGTAGVLGSSASFPIVLACNPATGPHRLRVRCMYATNGIDVTPCGNNSYGEVEDYVVTITEAAACPQPSTLTSSNVTSTSATLQWSIGCAESAWEVAVQPAGSGVPTGSGVAVTTNAYDVTDLTAGQVYEYYVRANCTVDGFSTWTGPFIFTAPGCSTPVSPANGATNVAQVGGGIPISWTASDGATSYDVYFGTTSGALTNIGNIVGTTANITNTAFGTTYFWSIAPRNANGAATGCTEFSFTTVPPPADDICTGATSLDALTSPVSGSTVGYANDFTPSCSSSTAPDRYYSITVPPGYALSMSQSNSYDSIHSTFYGTCAAPTEISCTDDPDESVVNWTNTTGTTQTVFWVQDGYSTNSGDFTLSWTLTPPPIVISSFTPASVCSADLATTQVTLTGQYFTGATSVTVNGVSTPFTVVNDTTIIVSLTATSTEGPIVVNSAVSTGSSASSLLVYTNPSVSAIVNGDATLCAGGDTADYDDPTPAGTWSSSSVLVASVDNNGIVTPVAGGTATISYSVTDNGCTTSVSSTVTVNDPIVSSNPVSQTVVTGTDAVYSVSATGGLAYQWQVSTDGGDVYSDLADGSLYTGVTTNTLTIHNTPSDLNENMYRVLITGASPCGDFESSGAALNVGDTGIASDPVPVTLCSTGSGIATFTVVGSGTVNSYQWYEDQGLGFAPIVDGTFGGVTYSGATTDQLTVSGVSTANTGWAYEAIVTGPANGATSNAATLTVAQGITVTTDPTTQTNCYSGGNATFTVAATGTITGYQWQYSNDGSSWSNVVNGVPAGATYTGATTTSLNVATTAATPAAGTYFYHAVINGNPACGSTSSAAAQLMIYTPGITSQPVAASVVTPGSTTFSVTAADPSATYQWQYATAVGGPYTNVADATPTGLTYTGATSGTLTVNVGSTATASSARFYRAIVTSNGCSVNSNAGQLSILTYCTPTTTFGGSSDTVTNVVITNVTASTNITQASSGASPWYVLYNNTPLNVTQGQSMSAAISFGGDSTQYSAVWIDYNQNGVFEATENVGLATSANGGNTTLTYNWTVPLTATPGLTRIRIRGASDTAYTAGGACTATNYGETEDYMLNIVVAPACSGTPVAGTISTNNTAVCGSGSVTLTATGYTTGATGIGLQWYNSAGLIAGATNPTYTTPVISAPETYYFRVTCSNSGLFSDSNSVTIGVNNPTVVSTTPNSRCGAGSVALSATGSAGTTLNWYAAATGGVPLATGSTFNTPSIATNTTYYVGATVGGTTTNTGKASTTGADGNFISTGYGIVFTASSSLTLTSAVIYPIGTGTITLGLYSSTGTELASTAAIPVTGTGLSTPVTVPINFAVPAGTGYRLLVKAYTGLSGLLRDFTGISYPYGSAPAPVTGSWTGSATSTSYYFFYNVVVSTGCNSARTAVLATVNTAPALTLSSPSTTICSGATSSAVTISSPLTNYDTYTWSPATGVSGTAATGYTFNPSATTVYTLSGSQTGGSQCQNTVSITVNVNPTPSALSVSPAAPTMCVTDNAITLTATGGNVPNMVALSENFNSNAPTWTITNGPSSPAASNWSIKTTPFTGGPFTNFTTTEGGKFIYANADLGGSGSTTNTVLTSPAFSTVGFTSATLTFEHYYAAYSADNTVKLEISTNGGATWATLVDYKGTTVGSATATAPASVSLSAYLNQPNLKIRYNYVSSWGFYWAIDNVKVSGTAQQAVTWTPQTGLYTDSSATTPYTGGAAAIVYAKPATTTTYTATATAAAGCSVAAAPVTVTVNQTYPFYADADGDTYGAGAAVNVCSTSASVAPAGYSL
ncbi:MAG: hypothetical protein EOP56_19320, partial [Sphingobacteriales bacterium]